MSGREASFRGFGRGGQNRNDRRGGRGCSPKSNSRSGGNKRFGGEYSRKPGSRSEGNWRDGGNSQKPSFWSGRNRRDGPHYNRNNQQDSFSPGRRLMEVELGITEYVKSDVQGFDGIIKARYSDFQVSEINVQGEVAKLTDLSLPPQSKKFFREDRQVDLIKKYNLDILPIDVWNQLFKMNQSADENYPEIKVDATTITKEDRTKIYDAVSKVYGAKVTGTTKTVGDTKFIVFSKFNKAARVDTRVKWNYPEEFVHFIVHKVNVDTMDAAQVIANGLRMNHVKPSFFGYSGTKDRRGRTSQWFSLRKVDPVRISKCAKRLRNIYVGNFEFKNYHLALGYLKGNAFRIALRNITEDPEIVNSALESFKEHGFLNYYGLQRFGSRADVPTYKIGRHLLRGEFREAIDLILTPQGPCATQLKCYKETGNASKALSLFPENERSSIEHILLKSLTKNAKNDLVTALEQLPRNMRLLYIHSFQSWVWNQCVSERIKRHGLNLVIGDLVTENSSLDFDISEDYIAGQWNDIDEEYNGQVQNDAHQEGNEDINEEGHVDEDSNVQDRDDAHQEDNEDIDEGHVDEKSNVQVQDDAHQEDNEVVKEGHIDEESNVQDQDDAHQEDNVVFDKKEGHVDKDSNVQVQDDAHRENVNKKGHVETIGIGQKRIMKYPKLDKTSMKIKDITQEDLSEGKYSIYDLVLPLPGFDVTYPSNMKDFYDKITVDEGVDVNVKQKIKAYNLSGTYRKVLIKPQNVAWKHVQYNDPHCDLIRSDWDRLQHRDNVRYCDNGKYRALILKFSLGSSTYATMALRELLKRDTSSETQAQKNDYHKDESGTKDEISECSEISTATEVGTIERHSEKRKPESHAGEREEKKIKLQE